MYSLPPRRQLRPQAPQHRVLLQELVGPDIFLHTGRLLLKVLRDAFVYGEVVHNASLHILNVIKHYHHIY